MFITHFNGRPAVWKTRRGVYPLAFESLKDGQAFLRWKKVPCTLATLAEQHLSDAQAAASAATT